VQDDLLDPEEWERVWIADETERTCELCQDLDGTTADLGEPFEGGIMRPTAHPSCRCTLGLQKKRGAHNAGPLEQLARRSPSERFAQSDTRTVLIYDHGDNVHLAERIARDVGRVLYYCPWQSELQYKDLVVGTGLPGVEKVETFWDHIEEADLIYCPDVHDYDVVETLREQGRKVVGAGSGARLELDREFVRELSASAGLPTINSVKIEGLGALIEYLKDVEDKWVKTNVYRGTMETFHHVNFESSKPILDELAVTLGPGAETIEFYVEDPVAGVEVGFETFIQGGKLLSPMLYGCTDGQCSLFRVLAYSELPAQFRDIFDKILPQIAAYNIRADFHTEIRFDGTNAYLTDVTMRPPGAYVSGLMSEAMTNFTDVLFGLADGAAPDPVFAAKMAGSVQLVSDHALKRWFAIDAPADADAWLKLTAYSKFEGRRYVSPGNNAIGGIVATGETLEEIVKTIEERYATLKSAGIDPIAGIDAFEALKV
jgi:hypothetical protein